MVCRLGLWPSVPLAILQPHGDAIRLRRAHGGHARPLRAVKVRAAHEDVPARQRRARQRIRQRERRGRGIIRRVRRELDAEDHVAGADPGAGGRGEKRQIRIGRDGKGRAVGGDGRVRQQRLPRAQRDGFVDHIAGAGGQGAQGGE